MRRMFDVFAEKPDPAHLGQVIEFQVGVAFSSDGSGTFRLRLDAIPLNFDGRLLVHLDEPLSVLEEKKREVAP